MSAWVACEETRPVTGRQRSCRYPLLSGHPSNGRPVYGVQQALKI